jgi:DNA repair exonuclease SbcCD nuclease subunit
MICIGDTHGAHNVIVSHIKRTLISDCVIFHVGDFGVGFNDKHTDEKLLKELNKFLLSKNITTYVIRGNHDSPTFFEGNHIYSNLKLMPDYSIVDITEKDLFGNDIEKKVLLVGGAISIDRRPRLREMQKHASSNRHVECYWFDEIFVLDEDKLRKITGVTHVITHTAPAFCYPDNKMFGYAPIVHEFAKDDPKLYKELDEERDLLTKMYNILDEKNLIQKWVYGHFHTSKKTVYQGTDFYLIGIGEFKEV